MFFSISGSVSSARAKSVKGPVITKVTGSFDSLIFSTISRWAGSSACLVSICPFSFNIGK